MSNSKKYLSPAVLSKIDNMSLRAKLVVEGYLVGKHKSPYHGFSVEFAEHRTYDQGDEIRHIDWKLYGKTDRYYVKRYEEETNLRSYILLDTSKSMSYKSNNITKLKYGESLSASLTHLMINQKDAVGLILFDNSIRKYIPPKTSKSHKNVIYNSLSKCKVGENTNIQLILDSMAERIKKSGLVILISDLLDDPKNVMKGLNHFRHKLEAIVIISLTWILLIFKSYLFYKYLDLNFTHGGGNKFFAEGKSIIEFVFLFIQGFLVAIIKYKIWIFVLFSFY